MAKTQRARLQISLDADIARKMDAVCARMGLNRSQYIAFLIGQNIAQTDTMQKVITSNFARLLSAATEDTGLQKERK